MPVLDTTAGDCEVRIDKGSTVTTVWTFAGTGSLTGTFTFKVDTLDGTDVITWNGTITDAVAREVTFTFPAADTAALPSVRMRYVITQTVGSDPTHLVKGDFLAETVPA